MLPDQDANPSSPRPAVVATAKVPRVAVIGVVKDRATGFLNATWRLHPALLHAHDLSSDIFIALPGERIEREHDIGSDEE